MTTCKAYLIYVDLDPMLGEMYTEDSAGQVLQEIFNDRIPHYEPGVHHAPESVMTPMTKKPGTRERRVFLLYINLDEFPGSMFSQESVQNTIRGILYNRISHYNPTVSLAPNNLQPDNFEGNIPA